MKLKTPQEKAVIEAKRIKVEKEQRAKIKAMHDEIAATENGRSFFKYYLNLLGLYKDSITLNPETGEVNDKTTFYLEARRSVYLDMRKHISDKHLKKIEFK
jgi:hypothetical protein|tara:strand:+ start:7066 stop:7368 length:303 start_codon:yes stop_codon:yes gene_type:complete